MLRLHYWTVRLKITESQFYAMCFLLQLKKLLKTMLGPGLYVPLI